MPFLRKPLLLGSCLLLLSACMAGPAERVDRARAIATSARLSEAPLPGDGFTLISFGRFTQPGAPLTVYLEGDGLAWIDRDQISSDPTPRSPTGLLLAAADPGPNVLYLGRPCQYGDAGRNPLCTKALWSSAIFSPRVVAATNQALDHYLKGRDVAGIDLVGFSGGGGLAVLLAAGRHDVRSLRTLAGNLDHAAFTSLHKVSPLSQSLNPADQAQALAQIPQLHLVGGEDEVVPMAIASSYAARMTDQRCLEIRRVEGVSHASGWPEAWARLVKEPVVCRP
jgi:pimeloyl-ACP methyl ester carboxylesterase